VPWVILKITQHVDNSCWKPSESAFFTLKLAQNGMIQIIQLIQIEKYKNKHLTTSVRPLSLDFSSFFPPYFSGPYFMTSWSPSFYRCAELIWSELGPWPNGRIWPNGRYGSTAGPGELSAGSLLPSGWWLAFFVLKIWTLEFWRKKTGIVHSGLEIKEPLTELQLETEMASRNLDSVKPTLSWSWTRSVTSHQGPFI
jgi:hypothetical protein